jgi:hypothetical protein
MRDIAAIRADIAFAITSPRHQTGDAITAALDEFERAVEARCTGLAPAEACPVHGPTGSPCDCGHDGGADCHPNARRTP